MRAIITIMSVLVFGFSQAQTAGSPASEQENPQTVTNHAITNPDILVVTGKILNAITHKPVRNAQINFNRFGGELIRGSVDENGNYALALNKKELGDQVKLLFKIDGYKRFSVKNLDKSVSYIDLDIHLMPVESEEKSSGDVKYRMSEDPFNILVIKMQ